MSWWAVPGRAPPTLPYLAAPRWTMEEEMANLFSELWSNSDLVVILGDQGRALGHQKPSFEECFAIDSSDSESRKADGLRGVLTLMVKGKIPAGRRPTVKINDRIVGTIASQPAAEHSHWFHEAVDIGRGILEAGQNKIEIGPEQQPDRSAESGWDSLQIRDVICHFQEGK